MEELCQYEGWLNIWDTDPAVEERVFGDGRAVPDPPWEPYFCVLREDNRNFTCYRNEETAEHSGLRRVRLDGGKAEFDRRWGYETLEIIRENNKGHRERRELSQMRHCKSAEELHQYESLWSPNPLWTSSVMWCDSPLWTPDTSPAPSPRWYTPDTSPVPSPRSPRSPRMSEMNPVWSPGLFMAFPAAIGEFDKQRRHSCVSIMPETVTSTPDRFNKTRFYQNRCNESLPDLTRGFDQRDHRKRRHMLFRKFFHSSYEKLQERRGSAPLVSSLLDDRSQSNEDLMDTGSTSSKIAHFFMKKGFKSNLKRTKSVTKLDGRKRSATNMESEGSTIVNSLRRTMSLGRLNRKRNREVNSNPPDNHPTDQQSSLNIISSRIRSSRSHESLLTNSVAMTSVDLTSSDVEVRPLHSSILGREHCIQVSTSHGSKYLSCTTSGEHQKWMGSLSRRPNDEHIRRTDYSLKVWVQEAKNVPSKKRYFCDICLDHHFFAKTASKIMMDMLFWGEQFESSHLPYGIRMVTVNLYQEVDYKKKKKERTIKACKIGYVNIPVSEITGRQYVEKWFTTSSGTVGKSGKENKNELPLIRLKLRYQPVQILPLNCYNELSQYLTTEYSTLTEVMENLVGVRDKEDIATTMIHILQKLDKAKLFLTDVVISEVTRQDNETLTFRGNSIATKAMEAYMKLVGKSYLENTLKDFVRNMMVSEDDCEVDPTRLLHNPGSISNHQKLLDMYCDMVWAKIINSHCYFPSELREIFSSFRAQCEEQSKSEIADNLICGSIFLRFLCPAILSPSLFHLTQEYPSEKPARNLTLIAKTIQTLANSAQFGRKEDFMIFMNDFIDRHKCGLREFLNQISNTEGCSNEFLKYDGYIDLGKELSLLHTLLTDNLEKANQDTLQKLGRLPDILQQISSALEDPEIGKAAPSKRKSQIYDNMPNAAESSLSDILHDVRNGEEDIPVLGSRNARQGSYELEALRSGASNLSNKEEYVSNHVFVSRCDSEVSNVSASSNAVDNELSVNQSWSEIVNAAEGNHGDYIDLISFIDEDPQNSSMELEQNINGSQLSISQVSTVASSGYQSYGYSQSSSPVESTTNTCELGGRDFSKSPSSHLNLQPLSFSNPMYRHKLSTMSSQPSHVQSSHTPTNTGSASSEEDTVRNPPPPRPRDYPQSTDSLANLAPKLSSSSSSESLTDQDHLRFTTSSRKQSNTDSEFVKFDLHSSCPSKVFEDMHNTSYSSTQCNQGYSLTRGPARPTELSHTGSMDFAYLRNNCHDGLRRTATDTHIAKTDHALYMNVDNSLSDPSSRGTVMSEDSQQRRLSPQNAVHMGIRSVQRKIQEQEKTKQEYEQEVTVLKQQLIEAQQRLQNAEKKLTEHETDTQKLIDEWHDRLEESEERMRRQQAEKDDQMKNIITRLMNVEDELRSDQEEMQNIVFQKQKVIEAQERRIQTLDTANAKLMTALNQLRNVSQSNHNGMLGPLKSTLISSELAEFKTSSC